MSEMSDTEKARAFDRIMEARKRWGGMACNDAALLLDVLRETYPYASGSGNVVSAREAQAVYSLAYGDGSHIGHTLRHGAVVRNDEARYVCSCGRVISVHQLAVEEALERAG